VTYDEVMRRCLMCATPEQIRRAKRRLRAGVGIFAGKNAVKWQGKWRGKQFA
jgi:hypothetical protein